MGGYECSIIVGDRRFRLLKSRFRRLMAVVVVLFLGWYLLYIGLSVFARGFMAKPVVGNVNVALVLGMLQFASTFLLAWYYSRYARRMLDPLSAQIRQEVERRREAYAHLMAERRLENWFSAEEHPAGGAPPAAESTPARTGRPDDAPAAPRAAEDELDRHGR